jgi:hypothetical protein
MATNLGVPLKGINKAAPLSEVYQAYSPKMNNVRVRDVLAGRLRIGQRPGLAKASDTQIGGVENPVVDICSVSTVS